MPNSPRNVLITGAGSGIGAAVAEAFAQNGDHVHLLDISAERLDTVRAALPEGRATAHGVDVTDYDGVGAVVAKVAEAGSIDVLAGCAGVFDGLAGVEETSRELWDRVIDITGANVRIENLSVDAVNNNYGILVEEGSSGILDHITVRNATGGGVQVMLASYAGITASTFTNNVYGVFVAGSSSAWMDDDILDGNSYASVASLMSSAVFVYNSHIRNGHLARWILGQLVSHNVELTLVSIPESSETIRQAPDVLGEDIVRAAWRHAG